MPQALSPSEPNEKSTGQSRISGIFSVTAASSGNHTGRVVLSDDSKTILFVPNVPFTKGEEVTVSPAMDWV